MTTVAATIDPDLMRWILARVEAAAAPEEVLAEMQARGWEEQAAIDAVEHAMRAHVEARSREAGLPPPSRVPAPIGVNGPSLVQAADRQVAVLASLRLPRVIVFGGLLADAECDALVERSRARLARSATVNLDTGVDELHEARTSEGTCLRRGEDELVRRIEARISALVDWPVEQGEGLQVLRYRPGAEYKPHYDYFDPERRGTRGILANGGQRVASLVMYLNTPGAGGATIFPDVGFEAAAVKGNAVFFSYDRPHPMTRSLHGGAPVVAGEKWIATKWFRERPCTA